MADLEKKDEKTRQWRSYSCSQLSAFCLQISLLLEAAVPLDEGFSIMAEDAEDENEKKMLLYMAEGAELGDPCFKVLEDTGRISGLCGPHGKAGTGNRYSGSDDEISF